MRHPASKQDPPSEPGMYWVQEHPNDIWRLIRFGISGYFTEGMMRRPWFRWMTQDEYEARSK